MIKALLIASTILTLFSPQLYAGEIKLRCAGEGKYNDDLFQVEEDLSVSIDKKNNGDVLYKILGDTWFKVEITNELYTHLTSRIDTPKKIKEFFELDRTSLKMTWIRTGINSDGDEFFLSYFGDCRIFNPEPKI